ncbi:EAL domain-containing protein [Gallaecimonas kandeliae]|uniref:putative bifunctional diguanylate cyclase/phosphodiesterase n=1 Tax=Gallaecimonas kandeliae TaxID=3029055 RepID=UPI0026477723|nr:EAL domain-containing protein [Gallaecimonas kandeliae]WKE66151.1 EAL domain-containing protein [Gallaecimonas kandeliae]
MSRRIAPARNQDPPFISLQLKLSLILLVLLAGFALAQYWWTLQQQQSLLDERQARANQGVTRLFNGYLQAQRQQAEQLVYALLGDESLGADAIRARLAERWPRLQQQGQWQRLTLRRGNQILMNLGTPRPVATTLDEDGGLYCLVRCVQQLTLPLQDGLQLELVLPLQAVLAQIHSQLDLDLLLLRPGAGARVWGLGVAESAASPALMTHLQQLTGSHPFSEQQIRGANRRWLTWWLPLEQLPAAGLLVGVDLSLEAADALVWQGQVLWWLLGGLFAIGISLWGWHLRRRLAGQVALLPCLAQQPQALPARKPGRSRDELDELADANQELAGQLAAMDAKMQNQLEMLEYRLRYDPLTGLANRNHLEEKLTLLLSHNDGEELAVIFADIQQFKAINDSLGYEQGDLLLQEVAKRLREAAGSCQGLGRFSADKFVVLLRFREREQLKLMLQQLHWHLQSPIVLPGISCQVAAVMGVAVIKDEPLNPSELLRRAELALHHAKAAGRSQGYYNSDMQDRLKARLELERDLIDALKLQQFELHLQPKYRLDDGTLAGFEGLIRWHHPKKGLVSPQAFIPQLESTDRIIDLGYWVIEEALAMLARLEASGLRDCHLAVNLACRQFLDASLPTFVASALRRHQLDASRLELEVTESSLVDHFDNAVASLEAVKALGVTVAIDDFGTGYSSLSYLRKLPFDVVKIDRSFVIGLGQDEMTGQIVQSLVELVHNLGGEVVAEGIETQQQLRVLTDLGCDLGQGLLLGPPLSEAQLLRRLGPELHELPIIRPKKARLGRVRED